MKVQLIEAIQVRVDALLKFLKLQIEQPFFYQACFADCKNGIHFSVSAKISKYSSLHVILYVIT